MSAALSGKFEGRFGKMFHHLPPAKYAKTDAETTAVLTDLGTAMTALPADAAKDGGDTEESGIPALYTYFGQFIDHDLTFGPEGSFQKIHDPNAVVDFRTPAFDLDCVYGRGPGDQPYMYDSGREPKFLLGPEILGGGRKAFDLRRNGDTPSRALIGDPRNDENLIVSQLQCLFLRFHNNTIDAGASFAEAQLLTQRHYQYIILNDFLPRIISCDVLDSMKTRGHFDRTKLLFFHPHNIPFMPVEFATAAYRFGHSMIRPGYRMNDGDVRMAAGKGDSLLEIFTTKPATDDLRGKRAMPDGLAIDWARLIDTEPRDYNDAKKRLQFAYKIDTSLVGQLGTLPPVVAADPASLPQRNLRRSVDFGLPSGQTVAWRMGVTALHDDEILIGKADGSGTTPITQISPAFGKAFHKNCPLWTYILAEAMAHAAPVPVAGSETLKNENGQVQNPGGLISTPRLGPVGGRIVAETFVGLMFADSRSLLGDDAARRWVPPSGADYKLKDFVTFAAPKTVGTGM